MPSVKVAQRNIMGELIQDQPIQKPKKTTSSTNSFHKMSITDGLNEKAISNEAMLWLRIMQKNLIFEGLNPAQSKSKLLKILTNEMKIKSGELDIISSVRDSIVEYYRQL